MTTRLRYTGGVPQQTLYANLNAGSTSLQIVDGTGWPTTFPYYILIQPPGSTTTRERIKVGGSTGTAPMTLNTLVRGQDGTTDQSHSLGDTVQLVLPASNMDELNQLLGGTAGDTFYYDGTSTTHLAKGAAQQRLAMNSGATAPEWTFAGGTPIFASTAARDTAIPSPTSGQAVYIDSGDTAEGLYFYNGTSWRKSSWTEPWGRIARVTSTSSSQTTISTVVDITGLTTTFTFVAGRDYKVTVNIVVQVTVATDAFAVSITDGSNTVLETFQFNAGTTSFSQKFGWSTVLTGSGSTTWKARIARSSGTGTASLGSTSAANTMLFLIEDIGPNGNPA